jgi:catechol 2,3-dioxygenase-like lactoylglutathione lyase family enzyme
MKLEGLDHVALTVRDVARSAAWYREILGLENLHPGQWDGVPTMVGTGGTCLALFPLEAKDPAGVPDAAPSWKRLEAQHVAFRASRTSFDAARKGLPARGVPVEFQDHEISHSIYFEDPDGHRLEITTYEV